VISTAPHRRGFAGEVGFIGGGRALGDFRVHGKLAAGLDEQAHAGADFLDGNLVLVAVLIHQRGDFGRVAEQGADFALGAFHGVVFERAGKGEQEEQDCPLVPLVHGGAAGGHEEHEEMHVQSALFAQALPKFPGGEPASGQIGQGVKRIAEGGGLRAVLGDGPRGDPQPGAQQRAEQLPFPFTDVLVGLGEFHVALDELGKRDVAPAPETRGGGAGQPGDGGRVAVTLDDERLPLAGGQRGGTDSAVLPALDQSAGERGLRLLDRGGDAGGQRGFIGAAEGGDGDFVLRPVDGDGLNGGVGGEHRGEGADQAAGLAAGNRESRGFGRRHGQSLP
jgi:hypothetical protein